MAVVRIIPSKKKAMFRVMIKMPIMISFGISFLLIWILRVSARKKGASRSEAKVNLKKAKVLGGISCRVILATTKFPPQIMWASKSAI